jgi:hypothetical protein
MLIQARRYADFGEVQEASRRLVSRTKSLASPALTANKEAANQ